MWLTDGVELLKTDVRRRPDLAALINGANRLATRELQKLQKKEQKEAQLRCENDDACVPIFFEKIENGTVYSGDFPASVVPCYKWKGCFPESAVKSEPTAKLLGVGYCPWKYITDSPGNP